MALNTASQRRTTYRHVLAVPRFRLLLATTTLAMAADSLRIATLAILIYTRTRSPLLSAVTYGIGFLPQLIGSALLGRLADSARPRLLIASGYALESAAAVTLALAELSTAASLALVALVACATPIFGGAANRLVGQCLTGDAYVVGRSLSNMASSGAQLGGLAVSGIAVATMGPHRALLGAGVGYAASALLIRIRLPDLPALKQPADDRVRPLIRGSMLLTKQMLTVPRLRRLLMAFWLPAGFAAGAESLVVPFSGRSGFPAGSSAWLLACLPVGMLMGELVVGRLVPPTVRERSTAPLMMILGLPLTAFFLAPPYMACAALLVIAGTGFAYNLGLQRPFFNSIAKPMQGQGFALLASGLMSVQGVGPALFGLLAQLDSTARAIAYAGLAIVTTAIWVKVSLVIGHGIDQA